MWHGPESQQRLQILILISRKPRPVIFLRIQQTPDIGIDPTCEPQIQPSFVLDLDIDQKDVGCVFRHDQHNGIKPHHSCPGILVFRIRQVAWQVLPAAIVRRRCLTLQFPAHPAFNGRQRSREFVRTALFENQCQHSGKIQDLDRIPVHPHELPGLHSPSFRCLLRKALAEPNRF